ncbi:DUF5130 domain-containing protein [Antrihabitans sp. YC2-6]|uniref:DUF5130 domain-containing protein n=1 Tax=Antrihabitans sp. YC2-6 TaxID=2799498 RepID=UPI0018F4BFAF|nr:DUF5130 domain-containing protein [Antrihabitans sp. YC2-6]MBJ8346766.1 DUF5130 domain-containing protein [Antrihabitans sp. YC2-6]
MASGSNRYPAVIESQLPFGSVLTSSGRVSAVHEAGKEFAEPPFTERELIRLDDALTAATRSTKIRFNIYVGDLGSDTGTGADELFPGTPEAARSILIAVSPNDKAVEVRTGRDVADRANTRVAQLGVTAAISAFRDGDLIDGLVSAVRVMSAAITSP